MNLDDLLGTPIAPGVEVLPANALTTLDALLGPPTNVYGGSGAKGRGTWCTPAWLAELIGDVVFDPCTNDRSHIRSRYRCTGRAGDPDDDGLVVAPRVPSSWLTFLNPPYERTEAGGVRAWVRAYRHVDFMFLLRWDPSTEWFGELLDLNPWVWFPRNRRIEFEPPPGIDSSSNPFPHALYCKSFPNPALAAAGRIFRLSDGNAGAR